MPASVRRRKKENKFDCVAVESFEHWFFDPDLQRGRLVDLSDTKFYNRTTLISAMTAEQRQQGVLWKRRDVFKNKWRPRWFVLQPQEAVLTYYLLSRTEAAASSTISTPFRGNRSNNVGTPGDAANNNNNNGNVSTPARHRTFSQQSTISDITNATPYQERGAGSVVSENPVDYDVVPRGAIYLAGCQVYANDSLSRPEEGLFAFTVVPPQSDENEIHLAARTEEARSAWVQQLEGACAYASGPHSEEDNGAFSEARDNQGQSNDNPSDAWKSLSPPETLFDNVPNPLAARIEQSLETYLELCLDNSIQWTPVFQDRDGVSAFTRQDLQGRTMMKSSAIIPHHPKQIANLLLDSARRPQFESNISISERLEVLNPHTFLDYYAYRAVWPTSSRDFAVALHWQVLQRPATSEEAIVTLAFSSPEADELREPTSDHVRAKLHVSFCLLRLIQEQNENGVSSIPSKCHITRILSYDLGGNLPRNLTNTVLMQQAGIPGVLTKHLLQVEPSPPERLISNNGPLTNEGLIHDVVEELLQEDEALQTSARRQLNFDKSVQEKVAGMGSAPSPDDTAVADTEERQQTSFSSEQSILMTGLVLLAPLVMYNLASTIDMESFIIEDELDECTMKEEWILFLLHPCLLFCVTAFFAVRYVVLQTLGERLLVPVLSGRCSPTTCRFAVDLKGVIRFINMKKEEKNHSPRTQYTPAEISMVHIVAIALVKAMKSHSECWNYDRVRVPLLGIDGYFRYPGRALDLLVASDDRIVTLKGFEYDNVQAVATDLLAAEKELRSRQPSRWFASLTESLAKFLPFAGSLQAGHGRCLILLTQTDAEGDTQRDNFRNTGVEILPGTLPEGLDVLVVVGSVRFARSKTGVAGRGSPRGPQPKPILPLSITINTATVSDMTKCGALAEELQKLIQFPELCDGRVIP